MLGCNHTIRKLLQLPWRRDLNMDYASLISEFGANYGMGDLIPDEDGVASFEADGRPVVFQKLQDSDNMIVTVELGAATDESAAVVNRFLLQANRALAILDGISLCLHSETGSYCLIRRIDVTSLDFIAFDKIMGTILDRAEQWGAILQKIIPVASSDADDLAESADEDAAFDEEPAPEMTGWEGLRQLACGTLA